MIHYSNEHIAETAGDAFAFLPYSLLPMSAPIFVTPQPTNWRKDAIDQFAAQLAEKWGLEPGADIRPLVERLGGTIKFQDPMDWLETESGSIQVRGPKDFTIFVSNFTSVTRDRFTIAHELGHFVLHSQGGKTPIKLPRSGSNRLEWEANWFAAGLLMPAARFKAAYLENSSAVVLAAKFDVSIKAAEVRKDSLGLSEEK
jgi:hypothetical protein